MANQGPKKHGNGNVQANVRANNSGQFEGTTHENVGFRQKKARKFIRTSPRTLPWNFITMLSAPLSKVRAKGMPYQLLHVCFSAAGGRASGYGRQGPDHRHGAMAQLVCIIASAPDVRHSSYRRRSGIAALRVDVSEIRRRHPCPRVRHMRSYSQKSSFQRRTKRGKTKGPIRSRTFLMFPQELAQKKKQLIFA